MIRQAHTYLAGAVSGSALIAAAVVAFVLLVSVQALRDWPLAGITGGGDESAVSSGRPAESAAGAPGEAALGGAGGSAGAAAAGAKESGKDRAVLTQGGQTGGGTVPVAGSPQANAPGTSPAAGGGGGASTPSASPNPGGGGGGDSSPPAKAGSGSSGGESGQSTSAAVTGTVNDTVSGVDKAVGGVLGEAGVTEVTEGVVNGVAGPETPIGKTIDKTVEAVGGLIGGGSR